MLVSKAKKSSVKRAVGVYNTRFYDSCQDLGIKGGVPVRVNLKILHLPGNEKDDGFAASSNSPHIFRLTSSCELSELHTHVRTGIKCRGFALQCLHVSITPFRSKMI